MISVPITAQTMSRLNQAWYDTYASLDYTRPFMYWCEDYLGCSLNRRGTPSHPWILEFKLESRADEFKTRWDSKS